MRLMHLAVPLIHSVIAREGGDPVTTDFDLKTESVSPLVQKIPGAPPSQGMTPWDGIER
jgi:hypothetical protein